MSQTHRTAIYVVHDDPVVMQTLLDFLSFLGYAAVPTASAAELLASLEARRRKADVVVAKLDILEKGGVNILWEVHERYPEVAFVLITDTFGSFPAAEAVSCGVYAYLREPIQLCELELSLARLGECNSLARLCESKLLPAPSGSAA